MSFDYAAAIAHGIKQSENKALGLLLIGPSGAGKSGTCGTLGVKTLYLYSSGEEHGSVAASTFGKDILPVQYDIEGGVGKPLTPEATYKQLIDIISDVEQLKKLGIKAIVVESANCLEEIIQATPAWNQAVKTQYKNVVSYAGPVTIAMFKPILDGLKKLRRELNIHYVMTCAMNVRELGEDGLIIDASPMLAGYNVVENIVKEFPDILILGQMRHPAKDTMVPRIQIHSTIRKQTSDFKTKEIRKILNCSNRITGVRLEQFPPTLPPNLAKVAIAKQTGEYPITPKKPKLKEEND